MERNQGDQPQWGEVDPNPQAGWNQHVMNEENMTNYQHVRGVIYQALY